MTEKKKHPVLRNLAVDIVCTGAVLVVFALFHHVLPRSQQSLNIVIEPPARTAQLEPAAAPEAEGPSPSASAPAESAGSAASDSASGAASATSDPASRTASAASRPSGRSRNRDGGSRGKSGRSGSGSNEKGGSALAETVAETPAAAETPASETFESRFTDTVTVTENSYSSPDISVTVTEETTDDSRTTYYLADIYVRDITCFRSALAQDTYGSGYRDSIPGMALRAGALLAVNGDYYGNTTEGVVIRNGVIYRANPTDCDVCVLYYDGTMRVMPGSSFSVEEAVADGAWQAWTFGPALLDAEGNAISSFSSSARIISANPRTALGYYEPGHYCLIVADGRGESAGMTLPEISRLFESLGCSAAYNLDGGNSSVMVWQGEVINSPSGGGRESSDALLIAEVNTHE